MVWFREDYSRGSPHILRSDAVNTQKAASEGLRLDRRGAQMGVAGLLARLKQLEQQLEASSTSPPSPAALW